MTDDRHLRIRLPDVFIERSRDFAERLIKVYADGKNEASRAVSCFDAERDEELQWNGKMSECAFAMFAGLDPDTAVSWTTDGPDRGHDVLWLGELWDVKCTHSGGRRLIWPITKNQYYVSKRFDGLVLVKHARPNFLIRGWISKTDFYDRKEVAPVGHKLFPGTWFVDQDILNVFEAVDA